MHYNPGSSPMRPPTGGPKPKVRTYPCACGRTTTIQYPTTPMMPKGMPKSGKKS